jgi:transglutaminase-like putative cysteine protease
MKFRVEHTTTYTGDEPASVGHNEARLRPRTLPYQVCHVHDLQVSPAPSTRSQRADYFGNLVWELSFNQGYDELRVAAVSDVTVSAHAPPTGAASPAWEEVIERMRSQASEVDLSAFEFAFDSPRIPSFPAITDYARLSFPPRRPILDALADLNSRIHGDFAYDPQATSVTTSVEEAFELRRGVCQDFAHLAIAGLRGLGLAARYVSGYLRTLAADGQRPLVGADASHAWLSVFSGPLGWVDLDPTNEVFPDQDHITVAWGRDYGDVPPLRGVFVGGGRHRYDVRVAVSPLDEGSTLPGKRAARGPQTA